MEQKLLTIFEKYGLGDGEITDAGLNKRENLLTVTVRCGHITSAENIACLERELCALMPGCRTKVIIRCGGLSGLLSACDEDTLNILKKTWCDILPVCRPAIHSSAWDYEGGTLKVRIPGQVFELVSDPRHRETVKSYYLDRYGIETDIELTADDTMELTLPEEEERPAWQPKKAAEAKKKTLPDRADVIYGKPIKKTAIIQQRDVDETMGYVTIKGEILTLETTKQKNGRTILTFAISDHTNTLPCKMFLEEGETGVVDTIAGIQKKKDILIVAGKYMMDQWLRRMCVFTRDVGWEPRAVRTDKSEEKRVELHLHTKMSSMDGLTDVKEAIKTAARWGHKAIAITDHGVVHAFPDAVAQGRQAEKGRQGHKNTAGRRGIPHARQRAYKAAGAIRGDRSGSISRRKGGRRIRDSRAAL